VDGSESACRAAGFAAQLAHDTGAKLTLMYVLDVPTITAFELCTPIEENLDPTKNVAAKGSFERAEAAIGAAQEVDCVVAVGVPSHEIVNLAKEKRFDQIVMGSRGLTPLRELLLGSVSIRVLRQAPCPVTIVH